jgi:hypothetical protein
MLLQGIQAEDLISGLTGVKRGGGSEAALLSHFVFFCTVSITFQGRRILAHSGCLDILGIQSYPDA